MALLHPTTAWVVEPDHAQEVTAPAYDSLTRSERRAFAQLNPRSFLNVTMVSGGQLRTGRAALDALIEEGAFVEPARPSFWLYRLRQDGHSQTAVVGDVEIEDYTAGTIRPHELTSPEGEERLVRYFDRVGINSSPVCLAYRPISVIDEVVAEGTKGRPSVYFTTEGGLEQSVWPIEDETVGTLADAFRSAGSMYITDGHHRSAAAARAVAQGVTGTERLLVALFPADQLKVHDFRRVLYPLDGDRHQLFSSLGGRLDLSEVTGPSDATPTVEGVVAVVTEGRWFKAELPPTPSGRLSASLGVHRLHAAVIDPLLAGGRRARLRYVRGTGPLEDLAEMAKGGIGFAAHPPTMSQVMEISDAGDVMPVKSTYFHPKARSGVFVVFRK